MKQPKIKTYKWSKSDYNPLTNCYTDGDNIVAMISPSETKEGKLVWGFTINTGKPQLINSSNCKRLNINISPFYGKKRDIKKAVETIITELKL